MDISSKLKEIREGYLEAELDTLEQWQGELACEFAFLAENIGNVKKDRALAEIEIKARLIRVGDKPTEATIEREFYATKEGQFLALNGEVIKAVSKLLSAIRFKIDAMKGRL